MSDFHLIAPRLPGAQGAISAAAVTATVPDPPRNFIALDNGTILRGTVQGRDKDGLIAVSTDQGILKIATNANLPPGSNVTLEVRSVGDRLQVVVLAVDQGTALAPAAAALSAAEQSVAQGGAKAGTSEASQAVATAAATDPSGRAASTTAPAPANQPTVVVAGTRLTAIVIQSVPRDLIQNTPTSAPEPAPPPRPDQAAPQNAAATASAQPVRSGGAADFRAPVPPPVQASLIPSIHDRIATLFAEASDTSDKLPETALLDADQAAAKAISAVGTQVSALTLNPEMRQRIIELFVGASTEATDRPLPDFASVSASNPGRAPIPQPAPAQGSVVPAPGAPAPVPIPSTSGAQPPQPLPPETLPPETLPPETLPPETLPPVIAAIPGPAIAGQVSQNQAPQVQAGSGLPAQDNPAASARPIAVSTVVATAPLPSAPLPPAAPPSSGAALVTQAPTPPVGNGQPSPLIPGSQQPAPPLLPPSAPLAPTAQVPILPAPTSTTPTPQAPISQPPIPQVPTGPITTAQQLGSPQPTGQPPTALPGSQLPLQPTSVPGSTPTALPQQPPAGEVTVAPSTSGAALAQNVPTVPTTPVSTAVPTTPASAAANSGAAGALPPPPETATAAGQPPVANPAANAPSPANQVPLPPIPTSPLNIPNLPDIPDLPGNDAVLQIPTGSNTGPGGAVITLPPSTISPSLAATLAATGDNSAPNTITAQLTPLPATAGLVPQDPTVPTIPILPSGAPIPVTPPVTPLSPANSATASDGKAATTGQPQGNIAAGIAAPPLPDNGSDARTAAIPLTAVVSDASKLPLIGGATPAGPPAATGNATTAASIPGAAIPAAVTNAALPSGATLADVQAEYQTQSTLGVAIGLSEAAPTDIPAGPLPTGTELRLRVLNIQQPGIAGTALVNAQAAASVGGKATIIGQILGHTPAGHPVIHSPVGDLVLQQQASLPVGASITLAIEAIEMANAGALGLPATPQMMALNLAQSWPTLLDLMLTLQHGPGAAGQPGSDADPGVIARLAQPGSKLAADLNAAMDAFKSGNFEKLFGPLAAALKSGGSKSDGVRKLRDEFSQLSMLAQERPQQDWRSFFLPIWDDGRLQQINFFYRRQRRKQGEKDKGEDATRFVVEVNFTRLGSCQLDGLIRKKHFDLMVRSHHELPLKVKRDLSGLFAEAREIGNYAGDISFQTTARFPVVPLDDVVREAPSVTA